MSNMSTARQETRTWVLALGCHSTKLNTSSLNQNDSKVDSSAGLVMYPEQWTKFSFSTSVCTAPYNTTVLAFRNHYGLSMSKALYSAPQRKQR